MANGQYDDLLALSRPVSKRHPPMSVNNRAAQFLPFAALSGMEDALNEAARETLPRIELGQDDLEILNLKLAKLLKTDHPTVTLTVFVPDPVKDGGSYVPISCTIRRIDTTLKCVVLTDGQCIDLKDIYAIDGI